AEVGSVAGSWCSAALIRHGKSIDFSRKVAMLACAVSVLPIVLAPRLASTWSAIFVIGLAAAAHQGFSANIFTLTSDMFPKRAVGSVVGLAGFCGAIGGMLMQAGSGIIKEATGSYLVMFIIAGSVYVLALVLVQGLVPVVE